MIAGPDPQAALCEQFFNQTTLGQTQQSILSFNKSLPPHILRLSGTRPNGSQDHGHQIGQELVVSCENCGDGLRAAISYISPEAEFSPPNIFSEAANDKLVFLVEAIPNLALAELAPGLPVGVSLP